MVAAPPLHIRRSSRQGRGSNGRDAQLNLLGDILTSTTRQTKRRFAPSDGLSLPNNLLAPAPKRPRKKKKVLLFCLSTTLHHINEFSRQRYSHPRNRNHVNNQF
jgi:hypothetical protein